MIDKPKSSHDAFLRWAEKDGGLQFSVEDQGEKVPFREWGRLPLRSETGRLVVLGPLLRVCEDEFARETNDDEVLLPHSSVAKLEISEATGLGLPSPAPFSLRIESRGRIDQKSFLCSYRYVNARGQSVLSAKRSGCLLLAAGRTYLLSDPLYSIIEAIDAFNFAPPEALDDRFVSLGILKEILNSDDSSSVTLDAYLGQLNVAKADHFTLNPFLNSAGEPDFEPVLVRRVSLDRESFDADPSDKIEEILPEAGHHLFNRQFRGLSSIRRTYATGTGWYAVISKPLKKALEVVRRHQGGTAAERRNFIVSPQTYLKEALGEEMSEEVLESLFLETAGYGERVIGLGLWTPPEVPLDFGSGGDWLPENVDQTKGTADSDKGRGGKTDGPEEPKKSKSIVVLIKGNLEELEIQIEGAARHGIVGEIPGGLAKDLLPHQIDGLKWLQCHWVTGSKGALLADDMGLGKTLQVLSFFSWLKGKQGGPCLIVVPTGLLMEWIQQHNEHLDPPGIGEPQRAFGSELKRLRHQSSTGAEELEGGMPVLDIQLLRQADWVVVTYETLRDYQHSFAQVKWTVIALDEAQKVKNPGTLMTHAVKALQGDFTVALTGTPVENRPADLWSIVDTVQPGRLGSLRDFASRYEGKTDSPEEGMGDLSKVLMESSKNRPPIVLRRLKIERLQGLPQKHSHVLKETMPALQAEKYREAVKKAKGSVRDKGAMLKTLHELRALSLHPLDRSAVEIRDQEYIQASARMKVAFNVLSEIKRRDEKTLVFLESLQVQGVLAELIQRLFSMDFPPMIINGSVSGPKRRDRVAMFQGAEGFDVMILSPRAGGVGFTLTAANHVVHLSRWWNPAVEDQCSDRVYRIGQTKDVHIYYPMAIHPDWPESSFDVRMGELLERKRKLFQSIMAPTAVTDEDMKRLFNDVVGV